MKFSMLLQNIFFTLHVSKSKNKIIQQEKRKAKTKLEKVKKEREQSKDG